MKCPSIQLIENHTIILFKDRLYHLERIPVYRSNFLHLT